MVESHYIKATHIPDTDMQLTYLIGNVTQPLTSRALIAHVCNDVGAWGRGVVLAIGKAYPLAEMTYRSLTDKRKLGTVQIVEISEDVLVANMIAQRDIVRMSRSTSPIRYDSLRLCLEQVYVYAVDHALTVHLPRIGCGLAGGTWELVEPIILKCMTVDTYVYTLESEKDRYPLSEGVIQPERQD